MLRKGMYFVVIMLFPFLLGHAQSMYTARQHFETVESAVNGNHGNQLRLVSVIGLPQIGPYAVGMDLKQGLSDTWIYGFYSPEENLMVTAVASDNASLGAYIGELGSDTWPASGDTTRIDARWKDSDEAAVVWKANGLSSFYDTHPNINFEGMVLGANETGELGWYALATDGIDSLTCGVNAVTLDVIECAATTLVNNLNSARDFSLSEAYPNPVRAGGFSQIDLEVTAPTDVTIALYDAQGREMGIISRQHADPQTLRVIIPSELLPRSGVYFIHAVSSAGTVSRKLVVTK